MNKIIEQLELILSQDPWKIRDNLRGYIEVLKELRDEAIREKEELEKLAKEMIDKKEEINQGKDIMRKAERIYNLPRKPEIASSSSEKQMILYGKQLVKEHFPETIS